MAKIKYVGMSGGMTSGGTRFAKGVPFEVSIEVAEYLVSTFGESNFELEEAEKVVPVPKKEEAKEKAPTKPKRSRASAKKVVE